MARWDVIVVGARVAGSSTAMLLARAGLKVLVLDRSRRGSDTLSTHALMRGGVLQLSRWGLLDRVVAGADPVRHTVFHYFDDEPVAVSIRPTRGVPALWAPRRTVLDGVLAQAAEDAGAVLRHGVVVSGLVRDADGSVSGVRFRDRGGVEGLELAALVVGADGRGSVVAKSVRAPVLHRGASAASYLYAYFEDLPVAGYEWFYADGVAGGLIPTHSGLTCAFVGLRAPDMDLLVGRSPVGAGLRAVSGRLPRLDERLEPALPVGRTRHVHGVPGFLRQAYGPGWALVGDAGYWKDPLSTHGMTDALRDAEFLAQAVLVGSDTVGLPIAMARYQATRDRLSRPMFEVVEEVASLSWDQTRIRHLLRALASSMTEEVEALESLDDDVMLSGAARTANP